MARRDQSNARKLELLNELANHRLQIKVKKRALTKHIVTSTDQIKGIFNIPKLITKFVTNKIKSSFASSPTKWFIGSAIGGLIITKLLFSIIGRLFNKSSEAEPKVKRGVLFTLLLMAARPLIKSYLIGKAQQYFSQKFLTHQQPSEYDYSRDSYYDIR